MKIYWKVKTLYCYLHDNYKYSQLKLNRINLYILDTTFITFIYHQ